MGESPKQGFQLSFNRFLRVGVQGSRVTSNGGLILVRELDERLGFSELIDEHRTDSRANNARFSFADLLRQSAYSRLAGYEDVNDAERLSQDPTNRTDLVPRRSWERGAALTIQVANFRDGDAGRRMENFVRDGPDQPGTDWQRSEAFQWHVPSGAGYGLNRDSGLRGAGTERLQRTLRVHLLSPAACCSIETATVWRPSSVRATCTVPRVGRNSCYPRLIARKEWEKRLRFGRTRPLPSRRCTRHWRNGV